MILPTLPPSRPRPRVEKFFPESPVAREVCQPPSLTSLSSDAMPRAIPRMSATECWVVESGPLFFFAAVEVVRPFPRAPVTWMPSPLAATRSMLAFRVPVVRRSLRFGSCLRRSRGNGVRSRIEEMTV